MAGRNLRAEDWRFRGPRLFRAAQREAGGGEDAVIGICTRLGKADAYCVTSNIRILTSDLRGCCEQAAFHRFHRSHGASPQTCSSPSAPASELLTGALGCPQEPT